MKKQWQAPEFTAHGPVEKLTQVNLGDLPKVDGFSILNQGFGLLASLEI